MALGALLLVVVGWTVRSMAALAVLQTRMVHADGCPIPRLVALGTLPGIMPVRFQVLVAGFAFAGFDRRMIEPGDISPAGWFMAEGALQVVMLDRFLPEVAPQAVGHTCQGVIEVGNLFPGSFGVACLAVPFKVIPGFVVKMAACARRGVRNLMIEALDGEPAGGIMAFGTGLVEVSLWLVVGVALDTICRVGLDMAAVESFPCAGCVAGRTLGVEMVRRFDAGVARLAVPRIGLRVIKSYLRPLHVAVAVGAFSIVMI